MGIMLNSIKIQSYQKNKEGTSMLKQPVGGRWGRVGGGGGGGGAKCKDLDRQRVSNAENA